MGDTAGEVTSAQPYLDLRAVNTQVTRAIVFDANVFGRQVEPNVETIRTWSEACRRHDTELWIPEVVAWELAQRVTEAATEFYDQVTAHNRRRTRWGLPTAGLPPKVTVRGVLRALEMAGAVIVEATEDVALEALRDQVLLLGPATRKHGVKTGAADSAWLRSVIAHNAGTAEGLIIVSGDSVAVARTCVQIGVDEPRRASHLGEIHSLLNEETPASPAQKAVFVDTLNETIESTEFSGPALERMADLDRRHWWDPRLGTRFPEFHQEWEHQGSEVQPDYPIEVVGPVLFDAWSNSVTGRIQIPATVLDHYERQDQWGDSPEYCTVQYDAWLQGEVPVSSTRRTAPRLPAT